jgi:hypothetical protein
MTTLAPGKFLGISRWRARRRKYVIGGSEYVICRMPRLRAGSYSGNENEPTRRRVPLMTDQNDSRSASRKTTLWLLGGTVVLTVAALWVGISDNPPGIVLLYLAGLALVLAGTHRWKSSRKFGRLFLAALLAFFILAVVHNFTEVGAERIAHIPVLSWPLMAVAVVSFLAAIIVCPMACLVGAVGWIVNLGRGWEGSA